MDVGARIVALERCAALTALPPSARRILAEVVREESYEEGETVMVSGELADCAFVVASGGLNVHTSSSAAPRRRLSAGDILGEYGLFTGRRRTATVVAACPSVLLAVDYAKWEVLLLETPALAVALLRTAVERLVALERASDAAAPDV
jgi:CRP-like cAMP-binding protein